ncbi:hypothetical protein [Thiocapsa roseopersicina]|uniref:Uncharacterized protein n=1 Tax=Thiocapsa roseopersicina TaxID=1058 RepID=A0A1H3B758_THIRO|nr:hypothetical protein [Thiocapsa roseopersicina]SDX37860.1 hypothetical protein SAMN05421783_12334 [Thiocapsa roseopersicina]
MKAVCKVIKRTEAEAMAVAKDIRDKAIDKDEAKRRCNAITPYNAEGAVDVAAASSTPSV